MKKFSIMALVIALLNYLLMYILVLAIGALNKFQGDIPDWFVYYLCFSLAIIPLAMCLFLWAFRKFIMGFIRDCMKTKDESHE